MRKKTAVLILSVLALTGASAAALAPAQAAPDTPVRAGKDSCGNFNVWVKGEQVIYYLHCGGPDWD